MYPKDLKYSREHEWVRVEDGVFVVGITAYAAEQLGDVTYVELPERGRKVVKGEPLAAVESVKAANDIFAPLGGEVIEVNTELAQMPELVNQSPYEAGWFLKLAEVNASELGSLLSAQQYEAFIREQGE
jgi:glycine cleavage system H protein